MCPRGLKSNLCGVCVCVPCPAYLAAALTLSFFQSLWLIHLFSLLHLLSRLRLAKMNEEMREAEGPYSQSGQYNPNSPTEMQYRRCMQEFISLQLDET